MVPGRPGLVVLPSVLTVPISLTRTVGFRAFHRLRDPRLSEFENRLKFGATADSHAHDYSCGVRIGGIPDPDTGMLLDIGALDHLLAETVVGPLDGEDLNRVIPIFANQSRLATCEAIAVWVFEQLADRLPAGLQLERVRIAEDASLHADCTGLP